MISAMDGVRGQPAYAWRGLSLDVARSFFPVPEVEQILDLMASLGMNRLHLHLADDQGWRIEVPGWPELTQRSGATAVTGGRAGFYSREDWQQLRRLAASRGVVLVPEIDLPGHSNAALHAVEGLNVDGVRPASFHGDAVGFSSLRLAAPLTERFIREVLGYVTEVSDGLVHVGGDESHATDAEEYRALVELTTEAVRSAGGQAVAWQEAVEHLQPGEYVQVWDERLASEPIVEAARRGVKVILSPASRTYLDMKYDETTDRGVTWMGTTELKDSASWYPEAVVPGLPSEAIAGVEAAVWTETLHDLDALTYMLLPRLAAVAEIGLRGSVEWPSFVQWLPELARGWDAAGWRWHRSPGVDWPASAPR